MDAFSFFTLLLGSSGVIANAILIVAILLRTPARMRVYSKILLASAVCDLASLVGMTCTIVKEYIVENATILEIHGVCAWHSESLCAILFGIQELGYSATSALLCLSFAYRFRSIVASTEKRSEILPLAMASLIILLNTPLVPLYHRACTLDDPIIEKYRASNGIRTLHKLKYKALHRIVNYHYFPDTLTLCLVNYSMISSLIPFIACLKLRLMTLASLKVHEKSMSTATKHHHYTLVKASCCYCSILAPLKAVNIQLLASAGFFAGCTIYSINLCFGSMLTFVPETTPLAVPISNLQNVIAAISNLYVITPYRTYATRSKL